MTRLITKNLGWKLFSLALAVLIWLALVGEPQVTATITVAVQYKNVPKDLEMSSDVLDRVNLDVKGSSSNLTPAQLADTAVVLDLSSVLGPGERTFPVKEAQLDLPTGVTVERSVPNQIRLRFERRLTREVPVDVRIQAPPPKGYEVASQRVEPERLEIVGPESHVRGLTAVETDPLDLSGVVSSAKYTVNSYIPDAQVRFATGGRVTVWIEVRKRTGSRD